MLFNQWEARGRWEGVLRTQEPELIVLDEDDEGVGRGTGVGDGVHPVGGTATPHTPVAPAPEVQRAIWHAYEVSEGRALPTNTQIIAPNPNWLSPPPQVTPPLPSLAPRWSLTPEEQQVVRQTYEEVRVGAVAPTRHSPCSSKLTPPPKAPARSQSRPACPTPQQARGSTVGRASTEPPLPPQKLLSEVPLEDRGAQWDLRQKPYVPWTPSPTQLWKAHCLLTGKGEWETPKCVFVKEGDPRHQGKPSSMRWECGDDSCIKLSSTQGDSRGHYQATHLGGIHTSPLCSCGLTFNSCMTLAIHLDIRHNVHVAGVSRREPRVYLMFLDWLAIPPTYFHGPTPPKHVRKR